MLTFYFIPSNPENKKVGGQNDVKRNCKPSVYNTHEKKRENAIL